jgi:hypothetical protein
MIRTLLLTSTLFISLCSLSQISEDQWSSRLSSEGIRIVQPNMELSDNQKIAILEYNYEEYRQEAKSTFIRIVDGPLIELYSKQRKRTQEVDKPEEDTSRPETVEDHIHPNERKVKSIKMIEVDIFGVSSTPKQD